MSIALGYTGPREALDVYAREGKPPPQLYKWRTGCRLCSGALETVLRLADTPPANELVEAEFVASGQKQDAFPLILALCTECDHVQMQTVVDPERMFSEYSYVSGTSPVFRKHLENLARTVAPFDGSALGEVGALELPPRGLVVEIGSNDGTLLGFYKDAGHRVLGIDPAVNLARAATLRGIPTLPAFFTPDVARELKRIHGPAELVLALNVAAHADGLAEMMDGAREMLSSAGRLVIEVAYLPDMLRDGTFDMIYHEHVAFWHLRPMYRFLARHGLHIYDAEHVDSQGGSIRVFASKEDPARPWTWRLARMCGEEAGIPERLDGFRARIEGAKAELTRLLDELKHHGKRICAFGAPAKSTTLLHHFGIGAETFEYIIEENPLKVGKWTPGTHIPIVDKEHAVKNRCDVCVCLAWNFARNIYERNKHLADHWLTPLPSPTWLA